MFHFRKIKNSIISISHSVGLLVFESENTRRHELHWCMDVVYCGLFIGGLGCIVQERVRTHRRCCKIRP